MPLLIPESPRFDTKSERLVWELLRDQLGADDVLAAGLRITDEAKDHEADLVVIMPGSGVVVVEVKGGVVSHDGDSWWVEGSGGRRRQIHPVEQALKTKYALRRYVEADPRWAERGGDRLRWAHAVVFPYTEIDGDFSRPECPRWMVSGRDDLGDLARRLWDIPVQQETRHRVADVVDAGTIAEILRGRNMPQRDVVSLALEREEITEQLTQDQATILGAIKLLNRVEIRGGAGSGKTWLAMEQARRLARDGQRVVLTCYSRGLAEFMRRTVATWPPAQQPAYVGEFHTLGMRWGAAPGTDDDSDYWERRLPAQMVELGAGLPEEERFDAVVVDEAQDFAESWWPALLAALRDDETGGVYAFTDDGQRVFQRFGRPPIPLVPLVMDHNIRNTRQIGTVFTPLTPMPMRLLGADGPAVRFISCAASDAVERADDEVDALIDDGWRPEDIALLTTGSRHPEQVARQAAGQDEYWRTFWDADQVFYGHVLGFKGMERRCVVLALNEDEPRDRSRERLYVGLSRARDLLVVIGDPDHIRHVGGDEVFRRLCTE
ncbi:NERD domain-containing protein [Phytoactinopolyspora halotolerans]|uniref:NERD domain-containing protein n=1 Tax=Phytoactinopolyspora halotolerans TaxID=1981512 RepID=UPI001C2057B3|nr:NERD domain-containing protein [Phytoactinopolyspora halotolerans]